MDKKTFKLFAGAMAITMCMGVLLPVAIHAGETHGEWREENGNFYWYENGVKQGTEGRGKEIFDPSSNAWYWLDAIDGGKKATSKDLYQESEAGEWAENADGTGKWVRYDAEGHMVKGWYTNEKGTYYFDQTYGTMAKGDVTIEGQAYSFDKATGILQGDGTVPAGTNGWVELDGVEYWYENGVRQGTVGRGKEIYDPKSDAWYWLDAIDGGKKATSKDVYQESLAGKWGDMIGEDGKRYGKWVRYDENGHMIKGWNTDDNGTYYFDPVYGTMAKGWLDTEGDSYYFDPDWGTLVKGSRVIDGVNYEFDKTTGVLLNAQLEVALKDGEQITENGIWEGISWTVTNEGRLFLSGAFTKENGYSEELGAEAPWHKYRQDIVEAKVLVFNTDMRVLFFDEYPNLRILDMSKSKNVNMTSFAFGIFAHAESVNMSSASFSGETKISLFRGCEALIEADISNVTGLTDMTEMFRFCSNLKTVNISGLDSGNATSMRRMFRDCSSLVDVNLNGVTGTADISEMFTSCVSLEYIDMNDFDTSNVTNAASLFEGCENLSDINLSNVNTSNMTDMSSMFYGCSSLEKVDVSGFDTSNVTTMTYMFDACGSLTSIDVSGFDTSKVTHMPAMFAGCAALTTLDVSNFDTSNVISMSGMFMGCCGLEELDVSNFNTAKVTNMSNMFRGSNYISELDLSNFDTSNVILMESMFRGCEDLKTIYVGPNWKISSKCNTNNMFTGCGTNQVTVK